MCLILKFYESDNIQKLKASSFRLPDNYICRLDIWRASAVQSSITFCYKELQKNAFEIGFNQHKTHAVQKQTTWRRSCNFMCSAAEHCTVLRLNN